MGKFTVHTGGTKIFVSDEEQNERIAKTDTESTRKFKIALLTHHFFNDMNDKKVLNELLKYSNFYKLNFILTNKKGKISDFSINIFYKLKDSDDYKLVIVKDCNGTFEAELPKATYKVIFIKRLFLFFKKEITKEYSLDKDIKQELVI